ncbi:hypothetical protein REH65_11655 [Saccharopolyspora sp. ID03-671]|uniref:hypothetical protein n=1 Tax=Saccharopolyspora sp. ID03-671 TaxID=3073066 RepID=UPI003247026C
MEMLFLMFVCGLAVATLVFWPLLHRANRKAEASQQPEAAPRGKHALGAAAAPGEETATAEASSEGEKTDREGEPTQPVKIDEAIAPQPRAPEPMEMPEIPTDIFEARYQAKFNRSKRRLERLRSEISKTG